MTGKTHLWSLNGGDGLVLRGDAAGCRFLASMHYRIIPTDPEKYDVEQGRWRVTTSAYLYEFRTPDNAKLWAMHWHPAGKSHATFPHLHLYTVRSDGHFVTPRQTLESAVQWCIEMVGRAAELPVAHRAGRVRGHPPALPIVVGGPVIATSGWMTSGLTAQDRDLGGQPMVHLSSHNPPSSDCAAPGEGWAEGPSRRDAQAPFPRPARLETLRGDGAGAASGRSVRRSGGRVLAVRTQSADGPQNGRKRPTLPDDGQR
jgi:hypothetical protein